MAGKTGKIAAVTGHRPKSLFGYDLMDPRYTAIRSAIKKIVLDEGVTELWTGMALGTDMLAALAVIDLQDEGHDVRLNAAIPFVGHNDPRWPEKTRMLYEAILYRAARKDLVTDGGYSPWALELRNRYMVDRADVLVAVYKGIAGGTANCIRYARRKPLPVWFIDPKDPGRPEYAP